jgi:GTPase SAR1 family protein
MIDKKETTCLHPEIENKIHKWIKHRNESAVLLLGNPGVGKTTLAHRIFKESSLKTIEFNASHTRSGASFRKTILPLLKEGGILQMMENGTKGGIGILLDEIDGLSNGERGGLQELLTYLKSPECKSGRPLILISNTLDSRVLQQIAKLCLTFQVNPPTKESIFKWLGQFPPENYKGDLRLLQRQIQGLEQVEEEIEIPDGVVPVAWWALWEAWDPLVDLDIENNEGNLASLITLENIPERIQASLGNTHEAWKQYNSFFEAYYLSDEGDFWAFFYQCWNILPLSLQLKLKNISIRLSNELPIQNNGKVLTHYEMRYTPVLTKQSAMFNAWKLLCEISNTYKIPIRLTPMYAENFIHDKLIKADKIRRYDAISLESMYKNIV